MAGFWRTLVVLGCTVTAVLLALSLDIFDLQSCSLEQCAPAYVLTTLGTVGIGIVSAIGAIVLFKAASPRISVGSMVWTFGLAMVLAGFVWAGWEASFPPDFSASGNLNATQQAALADQVANMQTVIRILQLVGGVLLLGGGFEHIRRSSHKLKFAAYLFGIPTMVTVAAVGLGQIFPMADENTPPPLSEPATATQSSPEGEVSQQPPSTEQREEPNP